MIKGLIDYFIPASISRHDEDIYHRSQLFVNFILITIFFSILYSSISCFIDFTPGIITMGICSIIFIVLLFLFRILGKVEIFGNLYLIAGTIAISLVVYYSGGMKSNIAPWFIVPPVTATLLVGKKSGWIWAVICTILVSICAIAGFLGYVYPMKFNQEWIHIFTFTTHLGLLLIVYAVTLVYESGKTSLMLKIKRRTLEIEAQKEIIDRERIKSEKLLLNILPAKTADELKRFGKTKAKRYELVSVLFADFKNFSHISEQLNPEDLVMYINHCFTEFDKIIEKYNIEKIKTIGDAYMCAGGIPSINQSNPIDVVNAAMEIQEFMKELKFDADIKFEVRIGVHTGPIVAGIVGLKKFSYDIWGETVNIASYLESHSEVGKVTISEMTYELIKHEFNCTYRGEIQAKGKNLIPIYFVNGRKVMSTTPKPLIVS